MLTKPESEPVEITEQEQQQITEMRHALERLVVACRHMHTHLDSVLRMAPAVRGTLEKIAPGNLDQGRMERLAILFLAVPTFRGWVADLENQSGRLLNRLREGRLNVTVQQVRRVVSVPGEGHGTDGDGGTGP